MPLRNVVYFPGSTIGNFTNEAALELLRVMHHEAGEDGALLIGVDLQKDPRIIERAYNDSAGVVMHDPEQLQSCFILSLASYRATE